VIEVSLVLSSIRSGLFSQNETVCSLALEVIERVADLLIKNAFEFGLQVRKINGKKSSIVEVKVPVFKQLQDWIIDPKIAEKPPQKTPSYMRHKTPIRPKAHSDPNSVLRIICSEVLETHPSLTPLVARLLLAIFREVEEIGLPSTLSIACLPSTLE
jgi:hypothetical protein